MRPVKLFMEMRFLVVECDGVSGPVFSAVFPSAVKHPVLFPVGDECGAQAFVRCSGRRIGRTDLHVDVRSAGIEQLFCQKKIDDPKEAFTAVFVI